MQQPLSPKRRHGQPAPDAEAEGRHCQYPETPFEWTRSEALAMARAGCGLCHGAGMRFGAKMRLLVCGCVLRAIFRACWSKYEAMTTQHRWLSVASLEPHTRRKRALYGRKAEEYIADFELVSRRALDEQEWKLFRYHFMLGAEWQLCALRLGMNRGNFFHAVYRVEEKLGRAFRELRPYSLFPLDEYFRGGSRMIEEPPRLAPDFQQRPVVRETKAREPRGRGPFAERCADMKRRQGWNGGRPMPWTSPKAMSAGAVAYGD